MGVRARARAQGAYDEGAPRGDDDDDNRYDEHDEYEAGHLYAYGRGGGGTGEGRRGRCDAQILRGRCE